MASTPGYQLGECAHGNAHVFEKQTSHREHGREHRLARAAAKASPSAWSSVANTSVAPLFSARVNNRLDFQHACRAGCVGLREQQCVSLAVQTHAYRILDSIDTGVIHELEHRRTHVAGDRQDRVGSFLY